MNNRNLTTDVAGTALLTEPLVLPGISVLIHFLWSNKNVFAECGVLIVKIFCLLVTPHLIFSIPAVTLGSHKHALRFIDRETEATVAQYCPGSCRE